MADPDLASLRDLKQELDSEETDKYDRLLQDILTACCQRVKNYCRREFMRQAITGEKLSGDGRSHVLILACYPVDLGETFILYDAVGEEIDASTYQVDADAGEILQVEEGVPSPWSLGVWNYSADYTAGWDPDDVPQDLQDAVVLQAAYRWQLAKPGLDRLGQRGTILDAGGSAQFLTGPWAQGVREILRPYRDRRRF